MVLQFAREAEAQVMETIAIASLAPSANGKKAREETHEKTEAENAPDDHIHAKRSTGLSRTNPQKQPRKMTDEAVKLLMLDQAPSLKTVPWNTCGGGPRVSTRRPKGVAFCAQLVFFRAVARSFA